jgi:formylglycine-generating enzyme required for sulfatase activity
MGLRNNAAAAVAAAARPVDPAPEHSHTNMVWIAGGTYRMGSDHHYPEEAPAHLVTVDGFWIDRTPVTNREFRRFVNATGYVTFAEIRPDANDYPGALPHMLKAGSLVFAPPRQPVDTRDWSHWWNFKFGANWRRPYGPRSSIGGLDDRPVVHIAYRDAEAYARWAGKELPTEAEWEFAARGGLDEAEFAWGDELTPCGRAMANTWQGEFPHENLASDGFERTSPVTAFPANGYGVYDMIGNVWEWTSDRYAPRHEADATKACCIPTNPRGGDEEGSYDPCQPSIKIPRKVIKGGSHLCAPNYCRRYRPAARHAEAVDTSTNHLGFRLIVRERPA